MEFEVTEVFKRSVTIERRNDACFETEESCCVYVNDECRVESRQNVITIDGLEPDTDYEIRLEPGSFKRHIRTEHESFLLNVRNFGAKGDGSHNDTNAIQAAIQCCPPDGTVYVPAGTYYTGPLFFKSHMSLWLDEGAVLLGDTDREHYPILPGIVRNLYHNDEEYNVVSWEGNPLDSFASLITILDAEGLDIFGRGTIDGNAQNADWWQNPKVKRIAWRPKLVSVIRSKDVRMQGVHVQNSPCWTVHPYYSERLKFLNLTISNPSDSPNTDGFDPESCTDVLLLGTRISVGDDCIAIKSGKLYMATAHHKETHGIVVRNCCLEKGHGSVTVGSEVAGGVSDVKVSQCIFNGTDRGVRIKTRRGRGERSILTGLSFENIEMKGVHMPVTINMFYFCDPDGHSSYVQDQAEAPVDYRTPYIGSIRIQDVVCTGVDASLVCAYGLPEAPIGCICLKRVTAEYLPPAERTPQRPVMMDNFPEISGRGLVIKNAACVQIEDVEITGSADEEPQMENVENCQMDGLVFLK